MITGSALRKLEAITGLKAAKSSETCYGLEVAPGVAFFSFKRDEKEACQELRDQNWHRVSRIVFDRQEWKCAECKQVKPLQGHHVVFKSRWRRAMGPLDHESNIIALCQDCHGDIHGQ